MDDKLSFQISLPDIELPTTVEECHRVIRELYNLIRFVAERSEAHIGKLTQEINALKEQLSTNSSNSSLPPSKDYKKQKTQKSPSKNSSGGQKGHLGHFRQLMDTKDVDSTVSCPLPSYCACGGEIHLKDSFQRHQVHELPEIKLHVTEYHLEKGCCAKCHKNHIADLPEGVTWGMTGPRLTSFMSNLVSHYQLSRRELQAFLKEHYQFSLSLGTVFNKQKIVNAALEAPTEELLPAIKESPNMNTDETGHKRDGQKQWTWCFAAAFMAYFCIKSRGKKVLISLIGDYKYVLTSDRYQAYSYFNSANRQMCWAHLKRDFTKLSEKKNKLCARIGQNLLLCQEKLFESWYAFKASRITRGELLRQTEPIRRQMGELLEQGSYTDPALKVNRFCNNLLHDFDALWTFLSVEHVEPTNNHAERCLRPSVTWRKKYFGTRSDYGSEFVARTSSVKMTCKLQKRNAFEFLCETMQRFFEKKAAPSLVPVGGT